jgi:hypothetical protein
LGQGAARIAHGAVTLNGGEFLMGAGHVAAALCGMARVFKTYDTQVKQ